jgi:hypothetical protein
MMAITREKDFVSRAAGERASNSHSARVEYYFFFL